MKILFFCPQPLWPTNTGARLRNLHLATELARHFSVTVLQLHLPGENAADHAARDTQFDEVISIERGQGYTPGRIVRGLIGPMPVSVLNFSVPRVFHDLAELLRDGSFDAIQLESVHLYSYLDMILSRPHKPKILADWHNIESELMRRYAVQTSNLGRKLAAMRTAGLLLSTEKKLLSRCRTHIVVSERERNQLLELAPQTDVHVIPNGVDTSYFCAANATDKREEKHTLLFVGSMDYHANIDAVSWFVHGPWREIASRFPQLHFTIAGRQPAPAVQALASERVHVTGTVKELRDIYASAFAVVVPLRVGGGTRLKILEAMAAGVPVISTRLGAEGLDAQDGVHFLLADTGEQMSEAIAVLSEDPGRRSQIIAAARTLVETQYDWRVLGRRLVSLYSEP